MKKNTGKLHIKTIICTIAIIICVMCGIKYVKKQYSKAKIKTIETNMSIIGCKATEYINKQKAEKKEEYTYVGTKLSDMLEDEITKKLLEDGIITAEECEKYYLLSNENLAELNTNISNEEGAFYIINYETGDVIITSGCIVGENENKFYKLDEIKNEDEKQEGEEEREEQEEKSENTEEKTNEEV